MTNPALAFTDEKTGDRYYRHPVTGAVVPSVTTILKGGIPKPFLVDWAAKLAAEHAYSNPRPVSWTEEDASRLITDSKTQHKQHLESAGEFGTAVHDLIEKEIAEPNSMLRLSGLSQRVVDYMNQWVAWCRRYEPHFIYSEVTVWSETHGYAGTLDVMAQLNDGNLILGDWKTSKSINNTYALQLAALAEADYIIDQDGNQLPLPDPDQLVIVHLCPKSFGHYVLDDWDDLAEPFFAAMKVREFCAAGNGFKSLFRRQ
jgi:hypothetical protein